MRECSLRDAVAFLLLGITAIACVLQWRVKIVAEEQAAAERRRLEREAGNTCTSNSLRGGSLRC